jgi:ABC-type proline/glycine betaine transport system permease subunit
MTLSFWHSTSSLPRRPTPDPLDVRRLYQHFVMFVLAGIIADLAGIRAATWAIAALTAASGLLAAARMYETHPVRPVVR